MAIQSLKSEYTVSLLCKVAEITTSSYYKWLKQDHSNELKLREAMQEIYDSYEGTIGYRRMYSELKDRGFKVGDNKVKELNRVYGLQSKIRRKKSYKVYEKGDSSIKIENKLDRNFKTESPSQKYCTDMTMIKTKSR